MDICTWIINIWKIRAKLVEERRSMDVIEEINEVVDKLNKIDEYSSSLPEKLITLNNKQLDLLHYIENTKVNIVWCYRMIKEMKKVRVERRKVKNDIDLLNKFGELKTKLLSKENRQFLLAELHKREKLINSEYKNREYSEEELQKILKGV